MRLVPGTVVDTPEGPRLLPPGMISQIIIFCSYFHEKKLYNTDIKGDGIDLDYVVQGFDIDQIEARYIFTKKKRKKFLKVSYTSFG